MGTRRASGAQQWQRGGSGGCARCEKSCKPTRSRKVPLLYVSPTAQASHLVAQQTCGHTGRSDPRGRLRGEPTTRGMQRQQLLRRRVGYAGVRVGESRRPGPRVAKRDRAYPGVSIVNGSGLGTPFRLLGAIRSSFAVVPEHRQAEGKVQAAREWAKRLGWRSFWSAAEPTEGGTSGGVAILARDGVNAYLDPDVPHEVVPARILAVTFRLPGVPTRLVLYGVYLVAGGAQSSQNARLVAALRVHAEGHGLPALQALWGEGADRLAILADAGADGNFTPTCVTPTAESALDYGVSDLRFAQLVDHTRVLSMGDRDDAAPRGRHRPPADWAWHHGLA